MNRPLALLLVAAGCVTAAGCSTPRSTRLQLGDLNAAMAQVSASLAASDWLNSRTSQSPPIVVTINKVVNLTTDLIPVSEQWMWVAKLRGSLPMQSLRSSRAVHFVIDPERQAMLRRAGFEGDLGDALTPTHMMSATFRSARREARRNKDGQVVGQTDFYFLEFRVESIASRQVEWTEAFEFAREAMGLKID